MIRCPTQEMGTELERLQRRLVDWKHIVVEMDTWLNWDHETYPYIMCCVITVIFLFIWLLQPPLLTIASIFVMLVCLLDFLVPSMFKEYFSKQPWSAYKQERYEKCCKRLLSTRNSCIALLHWVVNLRQARPTHYFLGASILLLSIAFLGNAIPGLLLAYFLAIFLVLLPGLVYRGIMAKYFALLLQVFVDLMKGHRKKD
ncbi:ADP-ribosylation factor-like protein 6-interacting protein 1 isoform X1 [Diadema antillarum]|uniref:ADP-ribosylation factor-like protein 6-interacting protein 1 isoform X1 n=1 Tax=Diadema antillarum TaxID=105358 RepID=UPI003A842D54